ncbi:MAG TPA: hypothetical protein VNB49_17835, partial [Candidatus Dormibacteraeota bacterium]|nr:hypothetical protein [Candidatus Dormibacteraeota bacterium]
ANSSLLDVQRNLGGIDSGPFRPTKQFTTDVLLTYLLHPGTAIYVGYNNGFTNLTLTPGATPPVMPLGPANNATNHLFFVKASYLLRF